MSSTRSTETGMRGLDTGCVRGAGLQRAKLGRRRYLMVAGGASTTATSGGRWRATATRRSRARERRRRCLGDAKSHPRRWGTLGGDVGGRNRRRRCGGAAAGEEEDEDGGDASGDPATIPCTSTRRTTWRRLCPTSICSAGSLTAAMRRHARLGFGHGGRKQREIGRERGSR